MSNECDLPEWANRLELLSKFGCGIMKSPYRLLIVFCWGYIPDKSFFLPLPEVLLVVFRMSETEVRAVLCEFFFVVFIVLPHIGSAGLAICLAVFPSPYFPLVPYVSAYGTAFTFAAAFAGAEIKHLFRLFYEASRADLVHHCAARVTAIPLLNGCHSSRFSRAKVLMCLRKERHSSDISTSTICLVKSIKSFSSALLIHCR